MEKKSLKKLKIPDKPGVYFFQSGKKILYIGKATSLKDRVKSYFGKDLIETRGQLLVDMLFRANKIDWQETDNALEALILEADLIKKHLPYYNTREKDDRSFNYVCITNEKLPRVIILRGKNLQKIKTNFSNIYGPFTNGGQLKEAMKIIRRIFPFLDDKSKNYLEFYRQINLVPDLNDRKLYLQNIKNINLFFLGKKKKIFRNLKKEMNEYAKLREFEKANEIKRQLFALKHINDVALIRASGFTGNNIFDPAPILLPVSLYRIEAYDIAHMGGKNMVGVMTVIEGGEVAKNEYRKFKIRTQANTNDTGALTEVLERRLAHREWHFPNLIVVDGGAAQINSAKKVLKKNNINIEIVSVVKNERHKPKAIMGQEEIVSKYKKQILLANSEAHRFAIAYHKKMRNKNFLRLK